MTYMCTNAIKTKHYFICLYKLLKINYIKCLNYRRIKNIKGYNSCVRLIYLKLPYTMICVCSVTATRRTT